MNNSRERDIAAKMKYLAETKEGRREIINMAVCNDDGCMGLQRDYMEKDYRRIAQIRKRKIVSTKDKYKRKSDFYFVLAQMADRNERIKHNPLP